MRMSILSRSMIGLCTLVLLLTGPGVAGQPARAQSLGAPAATEPFRREELAQMLGPIALYPDKLLSQILMASTYPIEVIEADRWIRRHPELQGGALDRALLDKEWDASVKALCHFPGILALMSERIGATTDLGNAFLAQEAEVMDVIQELRARAYARGNLVTTSEQKVIVAQETIIIEPANPWVVYVPYYDPFYVYGPWWYPAYPPYYWGPGEVRFGLGFRIAFWPGIYFRFTFGNWCYIDWPRRYIHIHVHEWPRFVRHDHWVERSGRWHHAPAHRRGVAYRDRGTAARYSQEPRYDDAWQNRSGGFAERREAAREDGRSIPDRDRQKDDRGRYEEPRRERRHSEPGVPAQQPRLREPADRDRPPRPERPAIDRSPQRQDRQDRVEPGRREHPELGGGRVREHIEAAPPRPERPRIESAPRQRQREDAERQLRQRGEQERRREEAIGSERPQPRREPVVERGSTGRDERPAPERGRFLRREPDERGRSGEAAGDRREERERNGR